MLLQPVPLALAASVILDIAFGFQSQPPSFDVFADWEHFGGHSYTFIKGRMGWDEARKRCRSMGADLASVHSEEENKFIYELSKLPKNFDGKLRDDKFEWDRHVWIGLRRSDGGWEWTDGSFMDYENWDTYRGEPNNFVPEENCAELLADTDFAGKWADVGCAVRTRGFVCKKAGGSTSADDWDSLDDNF